MVVDERTEDEVDLVFRALADRTRRDIVRRALEGEQSVSGLARRYPMTLPAVQKHVQVLETAGLITKHRNGREQIVRAELGAARRVLELLDEYEALWRGRIGRIDDLLGERPEGAPR